MAELTVLTPTYNREKELHTLFNSLRRQTVQDFEWVVVDDGSTDGTSLFLEKCKKNVDFKITCLKKANGGKHTALNFALKQIVTALVFIVDSDDYLTDDAVAVILDKYNQYKTETDLCGLSFLRKKADGTGYMTKRLCRDNVKSTYCSRINRGIEGDMAEVWYTEKLCEFPFPEFKGEKFLGEDTVWVQLSGKYKMRFFNQAIYVSEYLESGLTLNRRRHNIQSPNGCVARARAFLASEVDLRHKIKAMLQYFVYGRFAGQKQAELFRGSDHKVLALIVYFPAVLIFWVWKEQFGQ